MHISRNPIASSGYPDTVGSRTGADRAEQEAKTCSDPSVPRWNTLLRYPPLRSAILGGH
jgi:hypothetical protein